MRDNPFKGAMNFDTMFIQALAALPMAVISFFALVYTVTAVSDDGRSDAIDFSSARLNAHVAELASNKYEGRGAGYPGEAKAAEYIAKQFANIGLEPIRSDKPGWYGYLQVFQMHALAGPEPWQILKSQNVVGILPGKNPADGYIVIGAHYDGQGKTGQAALGRNISEGDEEYSIADGDDIWNSAVDNAVGVSAVLEIARTFL